MTENNMADYGFSPRFAAFAAEYPELLSGRIVAQEKGIYRIVYSGGERLGEVSGKFRYNAAAVSEFPAVGDFVMISEAEGERAVIHAVLPRKSVFIRRAAGTSKTEQVVGANIDTVFICMSLNNDFNLRRLERYLSAAWESGSRPVVVLTKADLCADTEKMKSEVSSVAVGADIISLSSLENQGLEALAPYIGKGETVALMGSSGVGKSTLINKLLGEEKLLTKGLRNDDKGHHTTTHRELLCLESGALIIDTPGMRELGMWDSAEGLEKTFSDIEEITGRCKFSNCGHNGEPGCAVAAALESGEISRERWESYKKLLKENAATSEGYLAAKEQKFKSIAKINKSNKKK